MSSYQLTSTAPNTRVLVTFGCPRIQSLYVYLSGWLHSSKLQGTSCRGNKVALAMTVILLWKSEKFHLNTRRKIVLGKLVVAQLFKISTDFYGHWMFRFTFISGPRLNTYWSNLEKHNFWRTILLFVTGRHFMTYCQINTLFCTVSLIFTPPSHLRRTNLF